MVILEPWATRDRARGTIPAGPELVFAPHVDFGAGSFPYSIAVGDFNRDGKLDVATANVDAGNVSVLLGDGSGSFGAATDHDAGSEPWSIAVGDFNADEKPDLAVTNFSPNKVSVLLGDGSGSFGSPASYDTGRQPESVAVGDFNGDGKQDLVTANSACCPSSLSVLLGDGSGSFGAATSYNPGSSPYSVAVGDFNRDGKQDLVVANLVGKVSVLLGDGSGSFGAPTSFDAGSWPISIAVGDFNRDGKQDVATANLVDPADPDAGNVSVLLGDGSGSFGPATSFDAGSGPYSIAVGDFNADGKQDLATANARSHNVSVLLGDGSGSFGAAADFQTGTAPHSIAVGDFNGDDAPDLVVSKASSNNFSLLRNAPTADPIPAALTFGSAGSPVSQGISSAPQAVTITNNGFAPLRISKFTFGGANPDDFHAGGDTCGAAIASGASCTLQVRFVPRAGGERTASLQIASNTGAVTPPEVTLTGTGAPPPEITNPSVTPGTFAVNPKGSAARAGAKRGTTIRYTLSEDAAVGFKAENQAKGRLVRGKCERLTNKNRKRKSCPRFKTAGFFRYNGVRGKNKFKWSGKVLDWPPNQPRGLFPDTLTAKKWLRPGTYRLTLQATNAAGVSSVIKRLSFKVVQG